MESPTVDRRSELRACGLVGRPYFWYFGALVLCRKGKVGAAEGFDESVKASTVTVIVSSVSLSLSFSVYVYLTDLQ